MDEMDALIEKSIHVHFYG